MKSNRGGFSLVDVLLLILGAMAIISATISISSVNQSADSTSEYYQALADTLDDNIVELNTKSFENLPSVDTCLYRLYDEKRKFLSEANDSITSPNCNSVATNGYKVVWKVTIPTNFTFSNAFLKIPNVAGGLKQIQVIGTMKIRTYEKTFSLTLLKDKK